MENNTDEHNPSEPMHKLVFYDTLYKNLRQKEITNYDNFSSIAKEFIKLNDDINSSFDKTQKLLQRSQEDYVTSLKYSIKNNIFYKYTNIFKQDFSEVLELLDKTHKDYTYICIVLDSLLKKINLHYFSEIEEILNNVKRIEFSDIKNLVDDCLQEIIVRNIPVNIISKYEKNNFFENINAMCFHNYNPDCNYALFNMWVPEEIKNSDSFFIENICFTKIMQRIDKKNIFSDNLHVDNIMNEVPILKDEEIYTRRYGTKIYSGGIYAVNISKLSGIHEDSKINYIKNKVSSEFMYISKNNKEHHTDIFHSHILKYSIKEKEFITYNPSHNLFSMHYNMVKRFNNDTKKFNSKYTELSYLKGETISSYKAIFDLINLIENIDSLTSENQLVILWSCMEKICADLNGPSIISKITNLNNKANQMYSLKRDLNNIYHQINDDSTLKQFFNEALCHNQGEDSKYNTKLFLEILDKSHPNNESIFNHLKNKNLKLLSDIQILTKNITNKDSLTNYFTMQDEIITSEINRIYRCRNILVHTNAENVENIEMFIQILKKYLYSMMSIIIHYSIRNRELTIKNIVFSIDGTYKYFKDKLNSLNKSKKLEIEDILPLINVKYLYL